ncbi:MAG TPA: 3-hydroxyacyl-CoA dehydrogenase family protein [Flavisolibacter sp.]|jgi:3-hydroxybutyryl-CoA dehydrogenase|nr:3-hydroxyacyl-CoA dehydrogenase family protein [Flavisolibacter sp.]
MQVVVISNDALKQELLETGFNASVEVRWLQDVRHISSAPEGSVIIDLLFEKDAARLELLQKASAKLVLINSVESTLSELQVPFVRINGWPTFLRSGMMEASGDASQQELANCVLECFGKEVTWVPDQPGFITARIVSMIINEAYYAVGEGVSKEEAINTAMKLGTNYPYGPFEWATAIGTDRVYSLLQRLSQVQKRYVPAPGFPF